jgi:HEAT repeat protein
VLGRLIAVYIKTNRAALLEPARAALEAILARMEDEKEEVSIRIHAMEQWTLINLLRSSSAGEPPVAAGETKENFHPKALWIEAMCKQLMSASPEVRSRAGEILVDNFKDRDSDPSFREAWRKSVPSLARAIQTDDVRVRNGAVAILSMLGPAAGEALPALRSLANHTLDASVKSAAQGAITSISSVDDLKAREPSVRAAAAMALGRLGWPATAAVPALATLLKDPEIQVRLAAVKALEALGAVSKSAVPALAAALAGEPESAIRVAIVQAAEAVEPGAPPVVDAHLLALRDPSPEVRNAGATFQAVPADDSVVSALEAALGDPDEGVRLNVANSLTGALFENPTVVPALLKGLDDHTQRKAVLEAVIAYLKDHSDSAVFSRVRGHVPALKTTLGSAIPALKEAVAAKDQETSAVAYGLLGRIVAFSGLTRDDGIRKAVEPAVQVYLKGLEESDPGVRQEVVGRLEALPVGQKDIVAALQRFLERSDLPADERQAAVAVLEVLTAPPGSEAAKRSRRREGPASSKMQLRN